MVNVVLLAPKVYNLLFQTAMVTACCFSMALKHETTVLLAITIVQVRWVYSAQVLCGSSVSVIFGNIIYCNGGSVAFKPVQLSL